MKRYDLLIFVFFVLFVCFLSFPNVFANMPLSGKVIFLDAGHPEYFYTRNKEK